MKWIQWRIMWAWGNSRWEYIDFPDRDIENIGDWLIETHISQHERESERFRGIEWDILSGESMPLDVLETLVRRAREMVKRRAFLLGVATTQLDYLERVRAERKGDL